MKIRFVKGQVLEFHGRIKGERRVLKGVAEEDGSTSVAQKFKVAVGNVVLRVPGQNIFIVHHLPSTPNS